MPNYNDKPGIVAAAQQAADAAAQASKVVDSVPGVPSKGVILHVLAGVGVAAGAVTAVATLGVVPGIIASLGGITMYVIGWLNPTPTAISQFGQSAK